MGMPQLQTYRPSKRKGGEATIIGACLNRKPGEMAKHR